MSTETQRAEFEAWVLEISEPQKLIDDNTSRLMWLTWQAAQASQAAEIEALRKDAERLDWLHQKLFVSKWNGVIDSGNRTSWHVAGDYRHTTVKMNGATFRDAIDAAMQTKEAS